MGRGVLVRVAVAVLAVGVVASFGGAESAQGQGTGNPKAGTECVDIVLVDSYGDGWNGAVLSITEVCGASAVLVDGLTLTAEQTTDTHHVCLDTTNGWEVAVTAGSYPAEITWSIQQDGTTLLQGGAPETGAALFSDCVCGLPTANAVSACLDGAPNNACGSGNTTACCAAVGEMVGNACGTEVAAAGVTWAANCPSTPSTFEDLCGGCVDIGMQSFSGNGWSGAALTISTLCGDPVTLATGITLPSGEMGTHLLCADSTNGWVIEASAGSSPQDVGWAVRQDGNWLLGGGAPATAYAFTDCVCGPLLADAVTSCLGSADPSTCGASGAEPLCCAAIGELVRYGCDLSIAGAGVVWPGECSSPPSDFTDLCEGCVTVVMESADWIGWNGASMTISTLCGDTTILAEGLTLPSGASTSRQVCLDTTNGWLIAVSSGTVPDDVMWSLQNSIGETIAAGGAPNSGTPVFSDCTCGDMIANAVMACLGGVFDDSCATNANATACCAAVDSLVTFGCNMGLEAAGVHWSASCATPQPTSFMSLCEGCVDIVMESVYQDSWLGTQMTIHTLCGERVVLAENITLAGEGSGTRRVCLDPTNGWSVSVGGGSYPEWASWEIRLEGEVLAQGSAPVSGKALFSSCACETTPTMSACLGQVQLGMCPPENVSAECCTAVGDAVRLGCDLDIASAGVQWADHCAFAPSGFSQFCPGYFVISGLEATDVARCDGTPATLRQSSHALIFSPSDNAGQGARACVSIGDGWEIVALGGPQPVAVEQTNPVTELGCETLSARCGHNVLLAGYLFGFDETDVVVYNGEMPSIPTEIALLTALTSLWLNDKGITSVPTELGALAKLTKLSLDGNEISWVPEELGNLTKLAELSLSSNHLSSVPTALARLSNLNALHLSDNQISSVPTELATLSNLKILGLNDNLLAFLPTELANLASLEVFLLNRNRFEMEVSELLRFAPSTFTVYGNYLWGCVPDLRLSFLNCMTECSGVGVQRTVGECMAMELLSQPPSFSNLLTATVAMRELRPGYRWSVNGTDEFSGWRWCLSHTETGTTRCDLHPINQTTLLISTPEEGAYTLTVHVLAKYKDMQSCSQLFGANVATCNRTTDECPGLGGDWSCAVDDVVGDSVAARWIVDTTPPTAAVSIFSVLDRAQIEVPPGGVVAAYDSFLFHLFVSEPFSLDASKIHVQGCNHAANVSRDARVDELVVVTCNDADVGVDLTVEMEAGAFVDRASNPSAFANKTVRTGCGVGRAFMGLNCEDCEAGETYADEDGLSECKQCSACADGWAVLVACTPSHDLQCQCTDGFQSTAEGTCEECESGKFRKRAPLQDTVGSCALEDLQQCKECSDCPFPRVVETSCAAGADTRCSSVVMGLAPLLLSVAACVATVMVLRKLNSFSPIELVVISLGAAMGFADFATDCYFIIYDARGLFRVLSVAFLAIPVLVNLVVEYVVVAHAMKHLNRRFSPKRRGNSFKEALETSGKMYAFLLLACSINPRLLRPTLRDYLPRGAGPHSDVYRRVSRMLVWTSAAPTVFQDLPQFAIQLSAVVGHTPTFSATTSLAMTSLSILVEVTVVVIAVLAWRTHASKPKAPSALATKPSEARSLGSGGDELDLAGAQVLLGAMATEGEEDREAKSKEGRRAKREEALTSVSEIELASAALGSVPVPAIGERQDRLAVRENEVEEREKALVEERKALADERAALEAERAAVAEAKQQIAGERAALAEERARLVPGNDAGEQ